MLPRLLRREVLYPLAFAAALTAAGLVCVSWLAARRNFITWDGYDRIKPGMSQVEVQEALCAPAMGGSAGPRYVFPYHSDQDPPPDWFGRRWADARFAVVVTFDERGEAVWKELTEFRYSRAASPMDFVLAALRLRKPPTTHEEVVHRGF
jgi:hypothetical protein